VGCDTRMMHLPAIGTTPSSVFMRLKKPEDPDEEDEAEEEPCLPGSMTPATQSYLGWRTSYRQVEPEKITKAAILKRIHDKWAAYRSLPLPPATRASLAVAPDLKASQRLHRLEAARERSSKVGDPESF
jgi:hypothetical protein